MTKPTPPSVATPADRERRAKEFTKSKDDDCLCQRTQPGTRYGEHIYIFCGCNIHEAFLTGAESEAAHSAAYWEERVKGLVEALERVADERRVTEWAVTTRQPNAEQLKDTMNIASEALAAFRAGKKETGNE